MFLLIDQLSESQLFPSRKSLGKYEPQEISELAYLHIIALNILLSEEYSHVWATNYAKKTTRSTNFKKWRNDATDLYVMMHALTDDSENLGDDNDADYYRDGIGIYPTMIFNWISRAGMNNEKEADTKRLFSKMDQMFRIRNGSMRAIRRLVQDWDDLSLHDKKLAMTRLLQFMRARCPKSDLLAQLTKLSASNKLELHGVNNPEALEGPRKPKGSFLLSLGAGVAGGIIGAALARKMREGIEWQDTIDTADLLKMIEKIHYNPEDIHDGDLGERLWKYDQYVLQSVPISKIKNMNQFCFDDDPMIDDYVEMPVETMPPIVLTAGYKIIDGSHRANAAKRRGMTHIPAYVGKPKVDINSFKEFKMESASGGGTGASCVAAVPGNGASAAGTIGAGFDLDYSKSVYPSPAPKKEKKKAVLSRLTENKAHYIGNCKDSFDEEGDCIMPLPWGTVSDFAVAEENAKPISKEEFLKHVDGAQKISSDYYVTTDGVYIQYDPRKDVHYFYVET